MSLVSLTIDNAKVQIEAGSTVLEAAKKAGIKIPTLCAWTEIGHTPGACRVCVAEVEGMKNLVASCVYPVTEGMVVRTSTERVRSARKMVVELLLANHPPSAISAFGMVTVSSRRLRSTQGSSRFASLIRNFRRKAPSTDPALRSYVTAGNASTAIDA